MLDKLFKKHQFEDSENQAVFTCCHIIEENKPILYVEHDDEGDWQFLCGESHTIEDARIIALRKIVSIDPSVRKVSNLKYGQTVLRESKESKWYNQIK